MREQDTNGSDDGHSHSLVKQRMTDTAQTTFPAELNSLLFGLVPTSAISLNLALGDLDLPRLASPFFFSLIARPSARLTSLVFFR